MADRWPGGISPRADSLGLIYTWWRGDPLPFLAVRNDLRIAPVDADQLLLAAGGVDAASARERVARGHRPYLATIDGEAVGYGWVTAGEAEIGELGITLRMPPGNRYLWDFATLPAWRGQGIYPRMLRQILIDEEAGRFWIGHDPANVASARGIVAAGFQVVGDLLALPGGWRLLPLGPLDRAEAAAALFGVGLVAAG